MKSIVKYTCFFIISFIFCLFINTVNIKASSDYIYLDNGDEVSVNLVENNITTYGEFVSYVSTKNNITQSRIAVYKWNDDLGWNLASFYNTFEGDDTVLLEFLPSNTCHVVFDYELTIYFNKDESFKIYSEGHRLPNLTSLDKDGYVFKGWYTYVDDKYVKVDTDEFYINDDSTVLYAEYTKKKDYKAWIIIGCVCFIAISSTITYFIKKKDKVDEK